MRTQPGSAMPERPAAGTGQGAQTGQFPGLGHLGPSWVCVHINHNRCGPACLGHVPLVGNPTLHKFPRRPSCSPSSPASRNSAALACAGLHRTQTGPMLRQRCKQGLPQMPPAKRGWLVRVQNQPRRLRRRQHPGTSRCSEKPRKQLGSITPEWLSKSAAQSCSCMA